MCDFHFVKNFSRWNILKHKQLPVRIYAKNELAVHLWGIIEFAINSHLERVITYLYILRHPLPKSPSLKIEFKHDLKLYSWIISTIIKNVITITSFRLFIYLTLII